MVFSLPERSLACSFSISNAIAYSRISANTPLLSSASQSSEVPILLQHPKGSFRLDRPVDPQQDSLLAGDSLPGGCPCRLKRPIDLDRPVLFRFGALGFVWAACAFLRLIRAYRLFKSVLGFSFAIADIAQFFPRRTGKTIVFFVIRHIFP